MFGKKFFKGKSEKSTKAGTPAFEAPNNNSEATSSMSATSDGISGANQQPAGKAPAPGNAMPDAPSFKGGQPLGRIGVPAPQAGVPTDTRPQDAPGGIGLQAQPPQGGQRAPGAASKLGSAGPDPSDVDYDPPLIQCLAALFKLHDKPVSTKLLVAGLASQDGDLSPSACLRSARNAGLNCKTVYRPQLSSISKFTLPCILLLRDGRACVLTKMQGALAEAMFPETDLQPISVSIDELKEEYIGYAIYAKPELVLDRRASNIKLLKSKRWFWDTLFNFMPMYTHVFMGSIVVNLLTICGPLFFMNVYDRVVPNKAVDTLWVLALGYSIGLIFDFVIRNLRSFFVDAAGRSADIILASKIMQQVLSMRLDHKPDSTGSLANNIREFESLRDFFSSTTMLALVDLPFLIIFLVIVSYIGGSIAIIPWAAVPIIIGVGIYLQYPLQRNTEKSFKENMQKNALLVEIINGLETVKTSMAEGKIQDRWEKVVGESALSNSQNKRLSNISMTFTMLASQLVSVSLIAWGVYKINAGELTQGGLIACNMLAGRAMAPLAQIASMLSRLQQSRMSLKSLDIIMNIPTERPESGNYVEFGHLEHSLSFDELSFKYPNSERFALEKISLNIKAGEKVGIIGRMGSGKSTLGRLAVGLFQPTEGAVKFGGIDIRQMDPADLRSRVGYLAQDNYLFYGTVRENISFGVVNIDDRMILRAANIAGVTDFVRAHPAGFGMPVGERGMSLSGGQRQAVAIARSLLHDSDVLILDEPSSNMDNSSELALKQRLGATIGNKTLLLITHRLSMLDIVDRLVVVENGKILADGPKKQVLAALMGGAQQRPQQQGGIPRQQVNLSQQQTAQAPSRAPQAPRIEHVGLPQNIQQNIQPSQATNIQPGAQPGNTGQPRQPAATAQQSQPGQNTQVQPAPQPSPQRNPQNSAQAPGNTTGQANTPPGQTQAASAATKAPAGPESAEQMPTGSVRTKAGSVPSAPDSGRKS